MRWYLIFSIPCALCAINYEVQFLGIEQKEVQQALEKSSELILLKKRPPASIRALNARATSDLPNMLRVLQAYGYYDAKITWQIEEDSNLARVILTIYPGIRYTVGNFSLEYLDPAGKPPIPLRKIGVKKDAFIESDEVLAIPKNLLQFLANHSYPLASIEEESYLLNQEEKSLAGVFRVKSGPKTRFGPLLIEGLKTVHPDFVIRKLAFDEGDWYNETLVEHSQKTLIDTGLFNSVLFSHQETLDEEGELPLKLEIAEAKHKNVTLGISYATLDGPGGSFGWNNRNVFEEGQTLALSVEASKTYSVGSASYTIPDFYRMDQVYFAKAEASQEDITPYLARTYELLQRIERTITPRLFYSIGLAYEYINIRQSVSNGSFSLLALPANLRYRKVDNLLNPTKGLGAVYKVAPYLALSKRSGSFIKQVFSLSSYWPIAPKRLLILAIRGQIGSILGTSLDKIPFNKRFLGGSDDNLRGYRYKTVSPLNEDGNPIGGKSALYGSFELRFRVSDRIGLVPFFDIGKVGLNSFPQVKGKWFSSVGMGLRYFLFFGPLRLDVGFPLQKRKKDQDSYKMYISIGQTF